ncbi:hypothetical protein BJX76DRAFT_329519 [Aspergillus varians]
MQWTLFGPGRRSQRLTNRQTARPPETSPTVTFVSPPCRTESPYFHGVPADGIMRSLACYIPIR